MPKIHPKFKFEKVCKKCKCTFLLKENQSDDGLCLGCGSFIVSTVNKSIEPMTGSLSPAEPVKTKVCKKCGKDFVYTHPAQKMCLECKTL